jgi:hypothetical protein
MHSSKSRFVFMMELCEGRMAVTDRPILANIFASRRAYSASHGTQHGLGIPPQDGRVDDAASSVSGGRGLGWAPILLLPAEQLAHSD